MANLKTPALKLPVSETLQVSAAVKPYLNPRSVTAPQVYATLPLAVTMVEATLEAAVVDTTGAEI